MTDPEGILISTTSPTLAPKSFTTSTKKFLSFCTWQAPRDSQLAQADDCSMRTTTF
jgi:hypothetical protein